MSRHSCNNNPQVGCQFRIEVPDSPQRDRGRCCLVDDLLDISRIARGKIVLARNPVDLTTVIKSAVETVSPLVQERAHGLVLDIPNRNLRVEGDPLRLAQVLGNVLGNACKVFERGRSKDAVSPAHAIVANIPRSRDWIMTITSSIFRSCESIPPSSC